MDDLKVTRTVIPAQPGWYVAEYCPPDEKHSDRFELVPVVAWEIERWEDAAAGEQHFPLAVTLDGPFAGEPMFKRPDGKFQRTYGIVHATEAGALNSCRQQYQRAAEQAAKQPASAA